MTPQKTMTAPGIRHNNPFNIRVSTIPWEGKISPNTGEFEWFQSARKGIRAGMKNSLTHQRKSGCDTIGKLIARHAPPNENATAAYAAFVAKAVGADVNESYDLGDVDNLIGFARAVIRYENGDQPYTAVTLRAAALAALDRPAC